jgi:hypothetical protein
MATPTTATARHETPRRRRLEFAATGIYVHIGKCPPPPQPPTRPYCSRQLLHSRPQCTSFRVRGLTEVPLPSPPSPLSPPPLRRVQPRPRPYGATGVAGAFDCIHRSLCAPRAVCRRRVRGDFLSDLTRDLLRTPGRRSHSIETLFVPNYIMKSKY